MSLFHLCRFYIDRLYSLYIYITPSLYIDRDVFICDCIKLSRHPTTPRVSLFKTHQPTHTHTHIQACRSFGDQGGYPTPSELVDYMDGQDKMSKSKFIEIMTQRVTVHNVSKEADFFFLTKGNPFACLDDEGKGCTGKAFRKCFMNLADKFNEKEYADIWTNLGIVKPGDDDKVDLDAIYSKLQDVLTK